MGTSQSSKGPGSGIPMVPPWTPDPPSEDMPELGPNVIDSESDEEDVSETPSLEPVPLAPKHRFSGARLSLGKYARSGDRNDMMRGLGRYVQKGYGGSRIANRRFAGTARTAEKLGAVLADLAAGQATSPGSLLDPALLAGRTAEEVMEAVVKAVCPVDGTQDTEAERSSIPDALSELFTRFPDADLLNLDSDQRDYVIEQFTAISVFRRFDLDLGKTIQEKASNATEALKRLNGVRDYIIQSVAASFRKLRAAGRTMKSRRIGRVVQDVLKETFEVFEGYAT